MTLNRVYLSHGGNRKKTTLGEIMSRTHGREEFLFRAHVILFSFFLSEIANIFPRAATLTFLILHHVLVRRKQMPRDDRRVFLVVTISVLGTSETKRKPPSKI